MKQNHISKADRQSHVDAWRTSSETQSVYCRRHGLNPATFNGWIGRFGGGRRSRRKGGRNQQLEAPLTFVQAKVQPPEHRLIQGEASSVVTLEYFGGSRLQFVELPPVEWLTELMRGL